MTYQEYLDRTAWKVLRLLVFTRDGNCCQRQLFETFEKCGRTDNLHGHHIKYPSDWGQDCMDNIVTLCADCHEEVHKLKSELVNKNKLRKEIAHVNDHVDRTFTNNCGRGNEPMLPHIQSTLRKENDYGYCESKVDRERPPDSA